MKAEELLNVLNEKKNRLQEIDNEVKEINYDMEKLKDILIKGTSFVPDMLAYSISYLVYAKEGKIYIPVKGNYNMRNYLMLVNTDELEADIKPLNEYSDVIPIYNTNEGLDRFSTQSMTFVHLRKMFNMDVNMISKYKIDANIYSYDEREYIKDFVTDLAILQIEKDGKPLTLAETIIALFDFIKLKEEKPKTRELNYN